jgi:Nif-specific regulatory protein
MVEFSERPEEKKSLKERRSYAKLIVCENGKERTVELSQRTTSIGRSQENVIEIDDINSSRRHCQIERVNGRYEIVDLKSRNGTLVNGVLVLRKSLRPGDCIEIGKTRMFFEHISSEFSDETIDLTTDHFLEPLAELESDTQLDVLKKEREIFLKLLEINRNINSRIVLSDLLELIVDTVVEVTSAERGFLLLANENRLTVEAARNMDRERVRDPDYKVSSDIASEVIRTAKPFLLAEDGADRRAQGAPGASKPELKSVLCVPIRTGEVVVGAIYVDNRFDDAAFSRNHLRWLEILADQAAVAIRNAQLFEDNRKRHRQLEEARSTLERRNLDLEEKVLSKDLQLEEVMKLIPQDRPLTSKYDYSAIITRSPRMFEIFRLLDKVTESSVPVLVLGESGTGKELIAQAIHRNGPRKDKRFVSENCAAIPINLMESEFFGHVRGAFTGATRDKRGLFEVADGGTLFLDEIADMPLDMQTKLLRVLQEGEIRRVGGKDVIKVDVRIVSATNKNIFELVRKQGFREDLLYRVNVITITLPPLRERREDIPLLVDFFLDRVARRSGEKKKSIDRETFHLLYQYDWPGNVRELENEIERLAALSGERIDAHLVSPNIQARSVKRGVSYTGKSLKEVVARTVEDVEMQVIRSTLMETNWKKSKAAEVLGISRPTLDVKIDKYKIGREADTEPAAGSGRPG